MNTPPDGSATVIRSEERLVASTRSEPVRRAVLRKVIVSEERTVTVVVRHEEFRLEYADVGAGDPLGSAPVLPLELVLHEERVVVSTAVVPVERVRVDLRPVVEQRSVTDTVRAERVDVDLDGMDLPAAGETPRHRA